MKKGYQLACRYVSNKACAKAVVPSNLKVRNRREKIFSNLHKIPRSQIDTENAKKE
jgi:hypothetical protein